MSTSQNPQPKLDIDKFFHDANRQANEFARTGLASLLLLNGGAIVALPPIGSLFSISIQSHRVAIVIILTCYVIGLVSTMFGYLIGFFVNSERSALAQHILANISQIEVDKSLVKHNKLRGYGIVAALDLAPAS